MGDLKGTAERPAGKTAASASQKKKRARLSQSDVPAFTLADTMRIPEALRDDWAKKSATPLDLAASLGVTPMSSQFRMLSGAAVAYGLTEGAAQSSTITLTDLGRRCVAPTSEGDDLAAMREAVLKPRVIREFLEKYDGNAVPQKPIALNVIETLNVPAEVCERAYEMILNNAEPLGLFLDIKGKKFVKLDARPTPASIPDTDGDTPLGAAGNGFVGEVSDTYEVEEAPDIPKKPPVDPSSNRVFITHGKNVTVVEQIKKILAYGKFEPVVSAQLQTVAKPVPDKVMDDMRSCSAAIVHVGIERVLLDEEGNQHAQINPNVLIEIGAAMALYDRRFVLLVERGAQLPSNLQGLYEVLQRCATGVRRNHEATGGVQHLLRLRLSGDSES
jgi:CAP12/Pycsar effector protein, TIR domain